jgi:hypothetical protein
MHRHQRLLPPSVLLAVVASGVLTASLANAGAGANLLAHWEFENNALDSTPNGHDGTLLGGSSSFVPGVFGAALDLTGSDVYVDIPTSVVDGEPECSLAYWIRLDNYDPGSPSPNDCCNSIFVEDGFPFEALHNNLKLEESPPVFEVHVAGTVRVSTVTPAVTPSAWQHVAYTYNQSTATGRFYLNGDLSFEDAALPTPPSCGAGLPSTIGAWDQDGAGDIVRFLDAQLDDFRVYDKELSATEVKDLFDAANLVSEGRLHLQISELGGVDVDFAGLSEARDLWPYYRIAGDPREYRFPAPDVVSVDPPDLTLDWTNVDGRGFNATAAFFINDCADDSQFCFGGDRFGAYYYSYLEARDPGTAIELFWYQNVTAGGTDNGDSARWIESPFGSTFLAGINVADVSGTRDHHVAVFSSQGNAFQVGNEPDLRLLLDDTMVTDLDGSGLPFAPGFLGTAVQNGGTGFVVGEFTNFINFAVFFDGFELGNASKWSETVP